MTKRRSAIIAAAHEYTEEIEARFPGAKTEVIAESFDGFDSWIRVELPPNLHDSHEEVLDLTADLNARFDELGIHLIATVVEIEEVAAHG